MIVSELIDKLASVQNQKAEVKVRLGWRLDGERHYTRELVEADDDTVVIGVSFSIDDPAADGVEPDEHYRIVE